MAKCTKGACCFHLRYINSITMLTTMEDETCIFYPTCASGSLNTLRFKLTPAPLPLCILPYLCSRKPKKKKKSPHPSLPTQMHIGNPLTQRHHLPVCTEQQQPLWILNLNGLIVPPTPICSKAASEPLSSKLWSPCRFFSKPIRICLPLKSHCEAAPEYKF